MAISTKSIPIAEWRWQKALIITRREMKDSLRDWRIMTPILILTLIFPILMDFTAGLAVDWAAQYNATIVGERLIPFMLMIVGFFPISFSLVIALETFVGEKERNSIEPLLSMPLTDLELYLGKMLAALLIPLLASYIGITAYLIGLFFSLGWTPDFPLLAQMVLLTTVKGLVMVSGAVVVSSQTTSVRAANLLASFIIIPMALLLQAESIFLFWGMDEVIWFIVIALIVVDAILIRMGIRIFNREDILGKEMDSLSLRTIWRDFLRFFLRHPLEATKQMSPTPSLNPIRIWRQDIPVLLRLHRLPLMIVIGLLLTAVLIGTQFAPTYPLPPSILNLDSLANTELDQVSMLPGLNASRVFGHNVRALVLSGILGVFSFGVIALLLLMIPLGLVGYFAASVHLLGHNSFLFVATFVLPHGLLEVPAAVIATTFVLRLGAAFISPPQHLDVGQGFLLALADFVKLFIFLIMPMIFVAALIEAYLTPLIVQWVYGGW